MPGKRTGLLALASTRKFSIKDLPVMPSDATSFSASSLEVSNCCLADCQPLCEIGLR